MTDMGERIARMEAWTTGHETVCAERQGAIMNQLEELRGDARKSRHMLIALLLAILAWSAREIWSTRALSMVTVAASTAAAVVSPAKPEVR